MATISPVDNRLAPGIETVTWETLTEADTGAGYLAGSLKPLVGSIQAIGTFGSATIALQGSNDNTNWVALNDTGNTAIALAAAGAAEFSTAMAYIRPSTSGGSSSDVDVIVSLRS